MQSFVMLARHSSKVGLLSGVCFQLATYGKEIGMAIWKRTAQYK